MWPDFWTLMGIFVLGHLLYVGAKNPEILVHRTFLKKGTETWDWVWLSVFIPLLVAILVVADYNIRKSGGLLPQSVRPAGVVLFVLGGGLFLLAMGENPFFEKTVRIQTERDHHVIQTGPYNVVRHPGYVGLVVWVVSFPLLLTSSWALLSTALVVVCLVVRTVLEDRTLHQKLEGYADYAARVRFRLIPGVW